MLSVEGIQLTNKNKLSAFVYSAYEAAVPKKLGTNRIQITPKQGMR